MPAVTEQPEQEAQKPAAAGETVGERIRRLRHERGLSQRDIASPGVTYAYVSRIEAGARKPSIKALRQIARKLRVPLAYLETGDPVSGEVGRDLRLSNADLALRLGRDTANLAQTFRDLLVEAHEEGDDAAVLRARIGLGLALARDGEHREAIRHLENATAAPAVTPGSRPDVFATLGRCYSAAGVPGDAVALFEHALAELPEQDHALHVRFTNYLSCALADRGEFDRARNLLAELSDRGEDALDAAGRAELHWSLARIASMEGHVVTAIIQMRRAVVLLEASEDTLELARAHLHTAQILVLEGEEEQASPHIERAARAVRAGSCALGPRRPPHRASAQIPRQRGHRGRARGGSGSGRDPR
jgi:transcriptional regulator with XRE-family HTH domain